MDFYQQLTKVEFLSSFKGVGTQRHRYTSEYKEKVAMEALKGQRTIQELASQLEVHPNQISEWKKELHERASEIFSKSKKPSETDTKRIQSKIDGTDRRVVSQVAVLWRAENNLGVSL